MSIREIKTCACGIAAADCDYHRPQRASVIDGIVFERDNPFRLGDAYQARAQMASEIFDAFEGLRSVSIANPSHGRFIITLLDAGVSEYGRRQVQVFLNELYAHAIVCIEVVK